LKGDNNTKYFRIGTDGKKGKNTIFRLHANDKENIGNEEILEHATTFYKKLFGRDNISYLNLDINLRFDGERLSYMDKVSCVEFLMKKKLEFPFFRWRE
jgi:hypothetical protein